MVAHLRRATTTIVLTRESAVPPLPPGLPPVLSPLFFRFQCPLFALHASLSLRNPVALNSTRGAGAVARDPHESHQTVGIVLLLGLRDNEKMPGGLHPPLELVLAWQTDAFPHGIRRGPTLAVVVAVMFFLTLFIVCGRLYARVIVQRNAGLDDLLIALAMVRLALRGWREFMC